MNFSIRIPSAALGRAAVGALAACIVASLGFPVLADSGPDVSSWQHPSGQAVNWGQVRSDGHTFAIVKATESTNYTNPYFAGDWAAIKANGMYRGAYHFARPADSSGAAQAGYFLSVVGNASEGGDLPPALDLEDSGGLSPAALLAWAQSFVQTIEADTGRKPLVYSYPSFWRNQMANTAALTSYPLWLADWTGRPTPNYPLAGGWSQYTFWQYTSSASVPGISGAVDMSQYCCDPASLAGLAYNAARWAMWYPLGGAAEGKVSVGTNSDGRLEAFMRTVDGTVQHVWQNSPSGGWTSWWSLNGPAGGDPVVATNRDGRLETFFVGADGHLWHNWQQQPSGVWGGWWSLGGSFTGRPAVVVNGDGRLETVVRGTDGALWHMWQTSPGGGWTSQGYPLGGSTTSDPSVATNRDGRLEAFVRHVDGTIWHSWQAAPSSGWGAWYSLGGATIGSPAVAPNLDGRLEVFAVGGDRALWHSWQTSPNGGWYQMSSFGGTFSGEPALGINADGRLEAFMLDTQGQVEHTWQVRPGGLWVAWATLGGFIAGSPPGIGTNADGRLEMLIRGSDNTVWHAWQTSRNGGL